MRLSKEEAKTIKDIIESFDKNAKIILFGSRANDVKRGGDIDLLILSDSLRRRDVSKIRIKLEDALGFQRYDIVIENDLKKPFTRIVYNEGVRL